MTQLRTLRTYPQYLHMRARKGMTGTKCAKCADQQKHTPERNTMNTPEITLIDAPLPYIQAGERTLTRDLALQLDRLEHRAGIVELKEVGRPICRIRTNRYAGELVPVEILALQAGTGAPIIIEIIRIRNVASHEPPIGILASAEIPRPVPAPSDHPINAAADWAETHLPLAVLPAEERTP